jgi:tetraacyldisaccharide 4'-kinase
MDDGFQNPSLVKDFAVLVVDARRGIGNGRVIPAGPMRAPLAAQFERADALVVVGEGAAATKVVTPARASGVPIYAARLVPDDAFVAALGTGRVLAFAGIGDPEKFFATLTAAGITVAATRAFPDHHRYTRAEAQALCAEADRDGLVLVTTEKDAARMERDPDAAELAAHAYVLPVKMTIGDEDVFKMQMLEKIARMRAGIA